MISSALGLADKLKNVRVLKGSGVDRDILHEADIENTETLVSLTDSDETNFLSAAFSSPVKVVRDLCTS